MTRQAPWPSLAVAGGLVLLAACQVVNDPLPPVPPPGQVSQVVLIPDDRAVIQALLDDLLRPRITAELSLARASQTETDLPSPLFLVFDHSAALCDSRGIPPPPRLRPRGRINCLTRYWLAVRQPPWVGNKEAAQFVARNFGSVPIQNAAIAPDVAFIPSSIDDYRRLQEITRPYPYPKPGVLLLSLPSYPTENSAIIAYDRFSDSDGGFVRLEKTDGRWTISDRRG